MKRRTLITSAPPFEIAPVDDKTKRERRVLHANGTLQAWADVIVKPERRERKVLQTAPPTVAAPGRQRATLRHEAPPPAPAAQPRQRARLPANPPADPPPAGRPRARLTNGVAQSTPSNAPILIDRGCFLKTRLKDYGPCKFDLVEDRKARRIIGKSADHTHDVLITYTLRPDQTEKVCVLWADLPRNKIIARYFEGKRQSPTVHEQLNDYLHRHLTAPFPEF